MHGGGRHLSFAPEPLHMHNHGNFVLIQSDDDDPELVERLRFGDTSGRDEAWLRDTLHALPQLLPIQAIDSAFGPLIPLCVELNCEVGRIDVAFVNPAGRLTLVECKLWRNPEARREVVAQTLDYASTLSQWTYGDLQRQVARATGLDGNVPFELVRKRFPEVVEHDFVDAVSRSLREGRFLLVVAGDGIREGVERITSLVQRNAALGFSFALVEIALYGMRDGRLLVQPRILARTHVVERSYTLLDGRESGSSSATPRLVDVAEATSNEPEDARGESDKQAEYRRWWQPVIDARFDDPEQAPAVLCWPNNVRVALPWPGAWLTGFRAGDSLGVFTSGRKGVGQEMLRQLSPEIKSILEDLPEGAAVRTRAESQDMEITCTRRADAFADDDAKRRWLASTLNSFVNALRPRLLALTK